MYRLGYIDLVQDKASVIPLWFLLSCILFAVVVLYLVSMRMLCHKIERDFANGKLEGLDKKILFEKKFCRITMPFTGDANTIFIYNYMCYMSANMALKSGNEEKFLSELDECEKKETFSFHSFILSIYYLSKDDRENAVKYYEKYISSENKNKKMNAVMVSVFENVGTPEEEQTFNQWKNNTEYAIVGDILSNIKQPLQLGDSIRNFTEDVKPHKRKWIWFLVLVLGMFVGGYYDSKTSEIIPETYSSPEEAYASVYPENTLQLKLEGRDSCLLIGSNSSRHDQLMVVEQDDEWICETNSAVKIQEGHLTTIFYYYYQYGEYDNYLVVRTARGDECIVQDAFESEFIRIESEKMITGNIYCTYLENSREDYWVDINGTRVTFEEN